MVRQWVAASLAAAAGTTLAWVAPSRPSLQLRSPAVTVKAAVAGKGASSAHEDNPEETEVFEVESRTSSRLDAFLGDKYSQSRSYFETLISRGAVLVNGKEKKKSFRGLRKGDLVEVRFLLDDKALPLEPENIPLDVLYEDEDLLVVNKEPGLVVHPAPGHWSGTLVNAVMHHVGASSSSSLPHPSTGSEAQLRPGIVHRLDIGTSGAVVVTKSDLAFAGLSRAFAEREVGKTYVAVVAGCRQAFRGHYAGRGYCIDLPLGRSTVNRRKMAVVTEKAGGRKATSLVRALAETPETSFLEILPRTGRTHQIRVHLAEEHTPVLGDTTYGLPSFNRRFAVLAQRPLLHARRLAFSHPRSGKDMEFEAPLPEDMRTAVQKMQVLEGQEQRIEELLGSP